MVLLEAVIVVAAVLFAFLLNWRTTAISLTAIPVSILATAAIFHLAGLSINTMTLGGLAIAIGELVDDAVVDVENIFRRLRENRAAESPRPIFDVVVSASQEVRSGIVYATMVIVPGLRPVVRAVGHRRPVVHAARRGLHHFHSREPRRLDHTHAGHGVLHAAGLEALGAQDSMLVRVLSAAIASFWTYPSGSRASSFRRPRLQCWLRQWPHQRFRARSCLPSTKAPSPSTCVFNPGISLARSTRVGLIAEQLIMEVPEVRTVGRRTGRAELDEHAEGVHSSDIEVDLATVLAREGADRHRHSLAARGPARVRQCRTADLPSARSHALGRPRRDRTQDLRRRSRYAARNRGAAAGHARRRFPASSICRWRSRSDSPA